MRVKGRIPRSEDHWSSKKGQQEARNRALAQIFIPGKAVIGVALWERGIGLLNDPSPPGLETLV